MNGYRILVAEDDVPLRDSVVRGLEEEGFDVRVAGTATRLLELASPGAQDGMVIDIGLPDGDGRDVCTILRERGITDPVVFLTALDTLTDRLSGYEVGADDYLTKPFAFAELVARLRAMIRRNTQPAAETATSLTVDPLTHAAVCAGQSVPLTPTEYRLLSLLVARDGQVVRRHDLIHAGWPHGAVVHPNTLNAYMMRLRRKLRRLPDAPGLATVVGVGFALR
jgi:two-component system, OmpR family, response regulator